MSDDPKPPDAPDPPPPETLQDLEPVETLTWAQQFDRWFAEPELVAAVEKMTAAGQDVPYNYTLLVALSMLGTVLADAPPLIHDLVRTYLHACRNKPRSILPELRRLGLSMGMTPRLYVDKTGGRPS